MSTGNYYRRQRSCLLTFLHNTVPEIFSTGLEVLESIADNFMDGLLGADRSLKISLSTKYTFHSRIQLPQMGQKLYSDLKRIHPNTLM